MAHCRLTHRTPDHHSGLRFSNVPGYRSVIPVIPFTSPKGERDLWSLKTFTRAYLFQIARVKIMWLRINNIHGKILDSYRNYAEEEFIQTPQVTLCVPSKQPWTIKTIIFNDIFTSLRHKKVQNPNKEFRELFGLVCDFFVLNQLSSALNYLKTSFILTNQNWVIFSCTLLAQKLVYLTLCPDIFIV